MGIRIKKEEEEKELKVVCFCEYSRTNSHGLSTNIWTVTKMFSCDFVRAVVILHYIRIVSAQYQHFFIVMGSTFLHLLRPVIFVSTTHTGIVRFY